MTALWVNIGLVLLFIGIGGIFAATEMSLVALRQSQIEQLEAQAGRGRTVARLAADPNRFLAAVQIGVTVAGFLSAAFGAATIADDLAPVLVDWGLPSGWANTLALVGVTIVISYASLVFGELVPKRLALQNPVRASVALGPPMSGFATAMRPFIWLLSVSTDAVVRIFGVDPQRSRDNLSDTELRAMVAGHAGLTAEERELIDEVFDAGERTLREVMVPRTEVDFLDASTPVFKAARQATGRPHSRYPVIEGSSDEVVGFVHIRDLLDPELAGRSVRVEELVRPVPRLPDSKPVLQALSELRRSRDQLAIVVDEYGGTAGIVSLEDLVEEIVGDIGDEYDLPEAGSRRSGAGVEVAGLLNLEDFVEETGCELPEGPYETAAGFMVNRLGRLPVLGDHVEVAGFRLRVTELDGKRISRLQVEAAPAGAPEPAAPEHARDADRMPPP